MTLLGSPPSADRRPWRRVWTRAALVPLVVLMPLVALAPTADHRFNLYWHGGMFRDDPLGIVPHTLRSIPGYLSLGNFRPLGRMLEKWLDLAAYTLADLTGVPVNITFRLVSFAAAVLVTASAVLLAESVVAPDRVFRRAPSTLAAIVPFAVGAGFVAAGSASPAVLFGGLYLTSAATVLLVAAGVCRVRGPIRWWQALLLVLGGATLACVNEIVYLALPLATVAALTRSRTGPAVRATLWLWTGFLPVFVAVRAVIRGHCAGGGCYRGSDLALGPGALEAVPARTVAWLPPLMWRSATDGTHRPWVITVFALLTLAVLAWRTARDLPHLTPLNPPQRYAVSTVAATAVIMGATLGALNADVQNIVARHHWGQGWRDTAVTAVAGGVLLATLVSALSRRHLTVALALLVVAAAVSTGANQSYRDRLAATAPSRLADRVALEMAGFDRSPAGNERRCALRAEFHRIYADVEFSLRRFDESLDVAAAQQAGVPFCAGVPAGGAP